MKTRYLFPHRFKVLGWLLLAIAIPLGIIVQIIGKEDEFLKVPVLAIYNNVFLTDKNGFFQIIENCISDELITIAIIIGGCLVGFSKLKTEDEFTSKLRSESLIWAFYVSSALNILFTMFVYGGMYFTFLIYNLFFQLLFFVVRFHYVLYKTNKEMGYEE